LSLFGNNFCSWAPIEKNIYFHEDNKFFYLPKKNSKNHDKKSAYNILPKIPFVLQRDNGPLGVNTKFQG